MRVEGRAEGRCAGIDHRLGVLQILVPGRGPRLGQAGLAREARVPAHADHVQQERPAVELAVDRALLADRGDDVVDDLLGDVLVPRLDHVGLDHRGHLDERRHADIDVPGALAVLGLGDEALDAEALDRRDLVVDVGEPGVDLRNARMQILDPLVEGRGQRARGERRARAEPARDADAGHAETGHQGARQELPPLDLTTQQLPAQLHLKDMFQFFACRHFALSSTPQHNRSCDRSSIPPSGRFANRRAGGHAAPTAVCQPLPIGGSATGPPRSRLRVVEDAAELAGERAVADSAAIMRALR